MDIASNGIVDMKGCQHSKHVQFRYFKLSFFKVAENDVFDRNILNPQNDPARTTQKCK